MKNPYLVQNLFGTGLSITWYALFICTGIVAGLLVGLYLSKKKGYNSDLAVDLLLWCLPACIIGARLYYVFLEWGQFKNDLISILYIWEGGLAIYGAVIAAVVVAFFFCRKKGISFGDVMDFATPGLILGQAIGRWGNFANQEAFGNIITNPKLQFFPFGVYIDNLSEWHQATFFYEFVWDIIVLGILLWYFKRSKRRGNVGVMYFVAYGVGRAFIEGLRTDSLWLIPGVIRASQLLSIIFVVAGIGYLIYMRNRPEKPYAYIGPYAQKGGVWDLGEDSTNRNVIGGEPADGSVAEDIIVEAEVVIEEPAESYAEDKVDELTPEEDIIDKEDQ